jgi:23S rRNA (uracil1939-C5)-methyltransferase
MLKQGDLVELEINDLSNDGSGVGRIDNQVVFIPDTVNGDRLWARLVRVKRKHSQGKIKEIITPSTHRIRPRCMVADKCGGCQWQHIDYSYQLEAKRNLVRQTLQRIGGFHNPPVLKVIGGSDLGYRNKVTYPLKISETGNLQAGYYQKASHKIVNLNQCPIQDRRLNPLLAEIKQDLQNLGISIYNEKTHQGALRHLGFRIGANTGEILVTLFSKEKNIPKIERQAQIWLKRYQNLVGVALNYNPHAHNVILGENTFLLGGKPYLKEIFAGLELHLRSETFFQVNTPVAEALLKVIFDQLNLQGKEIVVDAYSGIGTFTLPFAQKVQKAIGIELQSASVEQAQINADLNHISNVEFLEGRSEKLLAKLDIKPDLVFLDPPRQGCHREVIDTLRQIKPPRIVYLSCKSPSLARDLKLLCENELYQLTEVQPADFFPQTSHVECAAFLTLNPTQV